MKNSNFLNLLLTCSRNQGRALLETADKSQVSDIVKTIYNLSKNESLLLPHTKTLLRRHAKLIERLTNKRASDKSSYSLIRKNWAKILSLLLSAKKILQTVL